MTESAFPFNEKTDNGSHHHSHAGMTLRDYFATQALIGMGTWAPVDHQTEWPHRDVVQDLRARWAYEQADAMLRARVAVGGSRE